MAGQGRRAEAEADRGARDVLRAEPLDRVDGGRVRGVLGPSGAALLFSLHCTAIGCPSIDAP